MKNVKTRFLFKKLKKKTFVNVNKNVTFVLGLLAFDV